MTIPDTDIKEVGFDGAFSIIRMMSSVLKSVSSVLEKLEKFPVRSRTLQSSSLCPILLNTILDILANTITHEKKLNPQNFKKELNYPYL
jgi:hypothetical protein